MTQQSTPLRPGDQLASTSCATRVVVDGESDAAEGDEKKEE